jgi:hypothetical protein
VKRLVPLLAAGSEPVQRAAVFALGVISGDRA